MDGGWELAGVEDEEAVSGGRFFGKWVSDNNDFTETPDA
jgi:hypothetical protein